MTRYINKTLTCSVCGKSREYRVLSSLTVFDSDLDGYTGGHSIYDIEVECPYCHNVSHNITAEVSEKEKNYILSDEYQKAFQDDRDRYLKRFVETAKRKEALRQWLASGHYWLLASWRAFELNDEKETDYKNHVVNSFKNAMIDDEPVELEHMCTLVDTLRQLGKFEEARYYAESCMSVMETNNATDEYEYSVFRQEMALIENKNTARSAYRENG